MTRDRKRGEKRSGEEMRGYKRKLWPGKERRSAKEEGAGEKLPYQI